MMRQRTGGPMLVFRGNPKRDIGRKAQMANIQAGKAIADIVRTTMGPKSMLKMLLDPMGGIVMTNDGNAILREVDVAHPAAKSVIDLSRTQDEEVGDGTTSVVVLAGELLSVAEPHLKEQMHPTVIAKGYMKALADSIEIMEEVGIRVDLEDEDALVNVINSCLNTKFASRWGDLLTQLALKAVNTVCVSLPNGKKEIDVKKYAKVEKVPGGDLSECVVLDGVMINKDVTHPKMRRRIENPRVLLLDCPLEYKKGESQTNVEVTKEEDWAKLLEQEEKEVKKLCENIIKVGVDVVVTEKGVSDLAQHFLVKANITCLRRVRKTDSNRLSRATGATVCNRPEELTPADVGTRCGLFEIRQLGDEYFSFFTDCKEAAACTILLRGASKDVLNEMERNLHDAMAVARNIKLEAVLLPGGGAIEMHVATQLTERAKSIKGAMQWPYRSVATALEVIPRTLAQNCGVNVVRTMTDLRSRHAAGGGKECNLGIDGNKGVVTDVTKVGIWDLLAVKQQMIKTAIEAAVMLLRIDDVLSGIKRADGPNPPRVSQPVPEDAETFGDSRDG